MERIKRILMPVCILLLLPLCLEARVNKFYSAKNISGLGPKITLDGKLTDPLWQKGEWIKGFNLLNGKKPTQQTEFCILYDDKNIYVGVKCYEEQMTYIREKAQKHDGADIWGDELVEVLLLPPGCEFPYHFAANPIGTKYEETDGNPSWDGTWNAAGSKDANYWSMEIAIPLATIGVPLKEDSVWGMDVCRERYCAGPTEYSYWSNFVGGSGFPDPKSFGNLTFENFNSRAYLETKLRSLDERTALAENMLKKASPKTAEKYQSLVSDVALREAELKRVLAQEKNFTSAETGDFSEQMVELSKQTEFILRRLPVELMLK